MSEILNTTISGVRCDAPGCDEAVTGPEKDHCPGKGEYEDQAVRMGWTVWMGRSRRYYCPDHEPRPGHRMRLVAGYPDGGAGR